MTPAVAALAVLGCGLGALARYGISRLDRGGAFPWPTMVSNAVGSAGLGAVAAAVLVGGAHADWLTVLGGGVAGGLTTFSTLAVDAVILWREQRPRATLTYLVLTLAVGVGAAALGWAVGSAVHG